MTPALPELQERAAGGEIAAIYAEIRRLWGVPYVSSLQRHLATRAGWLEWTWAALAPAFTSGRAQTAAWRAAEGADVPRLPPISRDALRVWGVDDKGQAAIRATCESFVRVSPVNLVFAGLLRRLLAGERPAGPTAPASSWSAPPVPGPLPPLVVADDLSLEGRAVLRSLGTTVGAQPFVPGLYRMLAGWPGFLAHVATVLRPHLHDAATVAACARVLAAVDAEVPAVFAALPSLPADTPQPPATEAAGVLAALDTYRETSPQMVVFGRMLREALPVRPGA
jgi:hypothetical protein